MTEAFDPAAGAGPGDPVPAPEPAAPAPPAADPAPGPGTASGFGPLLESESPAAAPAHPRFRRRWLWEVAAALAIAVPVALWLLILAPRSSATKLLRQLNQVQVSRTAFNQVQRLAAQYGGSAACVDNNCLFEFQNIWLYRLHLAPMTEFSVMFQRAGSPADPGGGRVGAIDMAMLVSRDFNPGGTIASALVFDRPRGPYQASITFEASGRPNRTIVQLSPAATASQRGQARNFNLECLTRLGGCSDSHQLLPQVWNGVHRIETVQFSGPASNWLTAAATSPTTF